MTCLKNSIFELIKTTSTLLPNDVVEAISKFAKQENNGTPAKNVMKVILQNIKLAAEKSQPLCQDTGSILFFVKIPQNFYQKSFIEQASAAVAEATEQGLLRSNSVDPLSGINSRNNLGPGSPYFHFEQHDLEDIDVRLILKGGGCENVGMQYALPDANLKAGRDINGVRKCILDAIVKAQGRGCAPGILGVCIGGDRTTGHINSKKQFLRTLDDELSNSTLAMLEDEIVEEANELGIGPMGFGGKTTLLSCKIGYLNRLPASYFVTVSYMCWTYRRQGIILDQNGNIKEWIY